MSLSAQAQDGELPARFNKRGTDFIRELFDEFLINKCFLTEIRRFMLDGRTVTDEVMLCQGSEGYKENVLPIFLLHHLSVNPTRNCGQVVISHRNI